MIQETRGDGKNPMKQGREPVYEPNTDPSTGQHEPDIQDERFDKKNNKRPIQPRNKNPEDDPGNDPREYNDGDPVEEKSPRIASGL